MRIRTTCIAVLLCLMAFASTHIGAQQVVIENSQTTGEPVMIPGLGGRGNFKTGTGRISGRVVSADGVPLRRAQVRLSAPEIGAKTALTDAEGRFEFKDLPAGRFNLNASKPGYVNVQFGQVRPFEQGRPIELADKQVMDKVDISLPRGGVISGRIADEFGEPVADATVSAMRQTWTNGRRRLIPTGRSAQTNDLGQFRLYGLTPGEYFVSATLRNTEFMMFEAAMAAGPNANAAAFGPAPSPGYAPTYFPGTTVPGNAQRLTVSIGQETQNTDFALTPVRLARISGTVTTSDGKPVDSAMVNAMPVNPVGDAAFSIMAMSGHTLKDGSFSIANVAPGDYILNVLPMRIRTSDGGNTMTFSATIGVPAGAGSDAESAALPVTVAGEDLTNVVIVTSKGATASGRVTFEGSSAPPSGSSIRISAQSVDMEGTMGPAAAPAAATAKADGTFELKGLLGRRILRAPGLPDGWTLKAVQLNGEDITDTGIDFKPGQEVSGLEIVATSKLTEITGTVTAPNGTPMKDYTVVVFSEDPEHWSVPLTRWVIGTRPDQDGRFRFRNMPPGNYYAIALEYIEQGAWADPELLDRLKTRARRFTLGEGGTERLDLEIVEGY
jgi:Carboxypeptidase regulatory-like domain